MITAAQAFESDKNLQYQFRFITEQSPSNNHITRFSFGILKYQTNTSCIEFDFKIIGSIKSIRLDSIILIADSNKQLILKYPYRDTIHTTHNNSLKVATIHFLQSETLDFLKNNSIQSIVVIIDNAESYINLTRKNRSRLKDMIISN